MSGIRMTRKCFDFVLISLLLTVSVVSVASQQCIHLRTPIMPPNDSITMSYNCGNDTSLRPLNLINMTSIVVQFFNCTSLPGGLFVNVSSSLENVTLTADELTVELNEQPFQGLHHIKLLRLQGFKSLTSLNSSAFRSLRKLEAIIFIDVGNTDVRYRDFGAALKTLSGTPLRSVTMSGIHGMDNTDTGHILNVNELLPISNATIEEFVFINNIVVGVTGQLSHCLPYLKYACIGTAIPLTLGLNATLDILILMKHLENIEYYTYPERFDYDIYSPKYNIRRIHPDVFVALLFHFNSSCFFSCKLPITPSLRILTSHKVPFLQFFVNQTVVCFAENNNLEVINMTGSSFPEQFPLLSGLNRLRELSVARTGIVTLPLTFFAHFPMLQELSLNQLLIDDLIRHADSSFFGLCPTLKVLRLAECQLSMLPLTLFSKLASLQHLDLAENRLTNISVDLSNCTNMSVLNLHHNNIQTLPQDVVTTLDNLSNRRRSEGRKLTIDLAENPLSCQCNSVDFIKWMSANKELINFISYDSHMCLYPNGSDVRLSQVSISDLEQRCLVIGELVNGSNCPCNEELRGRVDLVWMSLDDYWCRNDDGRLVSMNTRPLPSCRNIFLTPSFIAPVVIGGLLFVLIVALFGLLIRFRKSEKLRPVVECLDMRRIVRLAIEYMMTNNRYQESPSGFTYDIFHYIHENDESYIEPVFRAALSSSRSIIARSNFALGSIEFDAIMESNRVCRWVVIVLSPSFVSDPLYCDNVARFLMSRPTAIVPIVWKEFQLATEDCAIASLIEKHEPLRWPNEENSDEAINDFWGQILARTPSCGVCWSGVWK